MVETYASSCLGCVLIHDSTVWIVLLLFLCGFMAGALTFLVLGIHELTRSRKDRHERLYPPE